MNDFVWEEIRGFATPGEYNRFVFYIDGQIKAGSAFEVIPDQEYQVGMVYGGRWIQNIQSGEVWRLVPPDFPFRGLWERVRRSPVL